MRFRVIAADYDDTLARHGRLDDATHAALRRFVDAGGRVLLVTGRELDELLAVCPRLDVFARVVAENGAVLHRPKEKSTEILADPPHPALVARLRAAGAEPRVGRVIVATRTPHDVVARALIEELDLPLHVVMNKGAVMILPRDVTKLTGLGVALRELHVGFDEVVAVGDAENDVPLLDACGFSVSVANGVAALQACADLVTRGEAGEGARELIDLVLSDRWPPPRAPSTSRGA